MNVKVPFIFINSQNACRGSLQQGAQRNVLGDGSRPGSVEAPLPVPGNRTGHPVRDPWLSHHSNGCSTQHSGTERRAGTAIQRGAFPGTASSLWTDTRHIPRRPDPETDHTVWETRRCQVNQKWYLLTVAVTVIVRRQPVVNITRFYFHQLQVSYVKFYFIKYILQRLIGQLNHHLHKFQNNGCYITINEYNRGL